MSGRTLGLCVASALALAACAGILGIRPAPEHAFEHRAHAVRGISCVQCHTRVMGSGADAALDLPDKKRCLTCHQEPHDQRACGQCHGREQSRRELVGAKAHLTFSHASHAGTTRGRCTRCHEGVAHEGSALRPSMATCLSCHEHREQWAARSCSPCHRNLEAEQSRPQSHLVHGEDFLGRHAAVAAGARDLCSNCHAESMCASCHGVGVPVLPSTFRFGEPLGADMHAAGFFARHGMEARVESRDVHDLSSRSTQLHRLPPAPRPLVRERHTRQPAPTGLGQRRRSQPARRRGAPEPGRMCQLPRRCRRSAVRRLSPRGRTRR